MDRNHIIINHNDFFKPLILGLKERGLEPIFDQWQPETELLQKSLACFIWFYDALRHPIQVLALKLQLQRYGVPLVAWNRDAPHYLNRKPWRLNLIDRFKLFDIYATHTLIDTKRKFAGMQLFLPNAANTELYNLGGPVTEVFNRLRQEKNYRYDISFFGGMDGNRYKEDLDRQLFFEALAKRLDEIGVHYKFVETGDKGIPLKEQIDLIQLGFASSDQVIGTVGRIEEQKGHVFLLKAFALLKQRPGKENLRLLIVGDGRLLPQLKETAEHLGIMGSCQFPGNILHLGDIYRAIDIFTMPSLWEGLSLAMLEAMAAGLPVVATDVGGARDVLGDNQRGILVPPKDHKLLAKAIRSLLDNPTLSDEMAAAGAEQIQQHYSITALTSQLYKLYRAALEN